MRIVNFLFCFLSSVAFGFIPANLVFRVLAIIGVIALASLIYYKYAKDDEKLKTIGINVALGFLGLVVSEILNLFI